MAISEITLQDLAELLRSQGFVPGARRGYSRRYTDTRSDAWIDLPEDAPPRAVPVYAQTVRHELDDWGVMTRDEFDEWMWRLIIARKDAAAAARNGGERRNGAGNGSPKTRPTKAPAKDPPAGPRRKATTRSR